MYREIIVPTQSDYTIHLPEEYIGTEVELIAFSKSEAKTAHRPISNQINFPAFEAMFDKHRVDLKGWKFNREEANNWTDENWND